AQGHVPLVGGGPPGALEQQPGLADARLAGNQEEADGSARGLLQQTGERRQLAVTTDEGRLLRPRDHRRSSAEPALYHRTARPRKTAKYKSGAAPLRVRTPPATPSPRPIRMD